MTSNPNALEANDLETSETTDLETAETTDLDAANQRITELETTLRHATARATRMEIASKHGLTFDRATEIFTSDDPEQLAAMEVAYAAGVTAARAATNPTRRRIVFADDPHKPAPPPKNYKAMAAELKKRA